MPVLPIRIVGDAVLRTPTSEVATSRSGAYSAETEEIIADMFDTLDASGGVGLSANQIGSSLRIFVYNCPECRSDHTRRRGVLVNPTLSSPVASDGSHLTETCPEGCLSVPGLTYPTNRAVWSQARGLDQHGDAVVLEGTGFFARMIQHEIGHLDGRLYIDILAEPHRGEAVEEIRSRDWGVAGLSWMPGQDPPGEW